MHSSEVETFTVAELKALPRDPIQWFTGVYLVKKADVKIARNGNEFLALELGDSTGSFHCTCFGDNPVYALLKETKEGAVIHVKGQTDYFQDRLSPRLETAHALDGEEAAQHLDHLIETSPEDPDQLWEELQDSIAQIGDPALRATVNSVIDDLGTAFRTSSAALNMHHAYRYGLLEHTVRVTRACRVMLPLYPEVNVDLALAGAVLHDVGKAIEYAQGGLVNKKTRTGILQGHIVLGYRLVRRAALQNKLDLERTERLEHIILSHQGELEWGAAVMAATPEAVFVSILDNLDAKMGMVQHTLRTTPKQDEFSAYLPGLKTNLLTTPITPPSDGIE